MRWPGFAIALLAASAPSGRAAHAEGDAARGRAFATQYCARCHVVGEHNRIGGIDSTPSFFLLAKRRKYIDRLKQFHAYRPHPVFVRMEGVERLSHAPAYATEFAVTERDIDDLVAYVITLKGVRRPPRRPRSRNRWQGR